MSSGGVARQRQERISWRETVLARRREVGALAIMAVLLVAFGFLLYAIRGGAGEQRILANDVTITRAIQQYRSAPLDAAARFLTFAGGFAVLVPVAVLVGGALLWRGRPRAALLLGASLLAGHPLNFAIKMVAQRPRPSAERDMVDVLADSVGTSFPSGHATSAVLFFGFLGFLGYVLLPSARARAVTGLTLAAFALGVGVSRVYVGGHWFSDIVGGWAVGLFLLIAFAETYRLIGSRELAPRRK